MPEHEDPRAGDVEVHPLTPERWADLEELFGPRGAVAGCWCMFWRAPSAQITVANGETNRAALRALVDEGRSTGLLAYRNGQVAGWCSVAPRADYGRLQRSKKLGPVDDVPVWSIPCFYIHRSHRRSGVAAALLGAAVEHARANGAVAVEGYPVDPQGGRAPTSSAYVGVLPMFEAAGFREIARRDDRPIVRRTLA
ncbi:MAG TPA: GNAT family N-acetyltransferase [Acidimicrobiales bacterium]|jgi:GNAT superfamily N-acetyltransferase